MSRQSSSTGEGEGTSVLQTDHALSTSEARYVPPSPEPGVCDYCHALLKGELIFMNSFRTMIPHHANLTALLTSSDSCPCCAFLVQSFNQTQIETWQREENTGETKHTPLGVHASLIGSSIYRIWVSHAGADIQGAYVYMRTSDGW